MFRLLLVVLAFLLPLSAYAQVKPVQDELHLMSQKQNEDLTKYLLQHKLKILVVTKASDNVEQDALVLGRNTGVDIIIWFTGKQVRVETGTRREGDLPDILSAQIVRDNSKLLRDKKYYDFFRKVSDEIYKKTNTEQVVQSTPESDIIKYLMDHPWVFLGVVVMWLILLVICPDCALFFVYALLSSKSSSNSYSSGRGDFSGGGSTSDD